MPRAMSACGWPMRCPSSMPTPLPMAGHRSFAAATGRTTGRSSRIGTGARSMRRPRCRRWKRWRAHVKAPPSRCSMDRLARNGSAKPGWRCHSPGAAPALALADIRSRRVASLTLITPAGLGPAGSAGQIRLGPLGTNNSACRSGIPISPASRSVRHPDQSGIPISPASRPARRRIRPKVCRSVPQEPALGAPGLLHH